MGGSQSHFVTDPSTLVDRKEWDYIIVGAGPAGCVLAHRLSQDANISVLLIEAGHSNADEALSRTPLCWPRLLKTKADWEYYTTPQPTLNMRSLHWPRGKLLGGSTSINAMMYQHAPPQDIDEWEKLGGTGWNAKTLAPYYRKAEGFTPSPLHPENQYRGDQGFWRTGYTRAHVNSDRFVQSCVNAGIPNKHDFNTPEGCIGASQFMTFIDANGQRSSAATAYLPPSVIARPNLTVVIKTYTTRLTFSSDTTNTSSDPKCIGVEVASAPSYAPTGPSDPPLSEAKKYRLIAKKEVILCAAAINTPQILMCSGIGPDDVLREAGIPKLAAKSEELGKQVGKNLYDHLCVCVPFRAKESLDYLKDPFKLFPYLIQYLLFGTGPLTTNAAEAAAFIRLDDTRELWGSSASALHGAPVPDTTSGPGAPDIELIGSPASPLSMPDVSEKSFTIATVHLRPISAGTITVKSGNAFQKAICEPNYLDSNIDLHALIRAVRVTLKIAHTQPLSDHLVFNDPKTEPNADKASMYWLADQDPGKLTDEEIEEWVRANAQPVFHPTSTCRLADSPSNGVVDPALRVFGIENLRVCDASIFPAQIAAHPTATIIAAAERVADIILNGTPSPS